MLASLLSTELHRPAPAAGRGVFKPPAGGRVRSAARACGGRRRRMPHASHTPARTAGTPTCTRTIHASRRLSPERAHSLPRYRVSTAQHTMSRSVLPLLLHAVVQSTAPHLLVHGLPTHTDNPLHTGAVDAGGLPAPTLPSLQRGRDPPALLGASHLKYMSFCEGLPLTLASIKLNLLLRQRAAVRGLGFAWMVGVSSTVMQRCHRCSPGVLVARGPRRRTQPQADERLAEPGARAVWRR